MSRAVLLQARYGLPGGQTTSDTGASLPKEA